VPPERVEALQRTTPTDIEWLSERDVSQRLRALAGEIADYAAETAVA